jgi:hypothetical protein
MGSLIRIMNVSRTQITLYQWHLSCLSSLALGTFSTLVCSEFESFPSACLLVLSSSIILFWATGLVLFENRVMSHKLKRTKILGRRGGRWLVEVSWLLIRKFLIADQTSSGSRTRIFAPYRRPFSILPFSHFPPFLTSSTQCERPISYTHHMR